MKQADLLIFFCFQVVLGGYLWADTTIYWGEAKTPSGKIAYTERHTVISMNDVLKSTRTEYFDADRKKKIAVLDSDYSKSLSMPTYEFRDLRSSYREGVAMSDGKYMAYFKKQGEPKKSKEIKKGNRIFSGQGWHYYLIKNLDLLEKNDIVLNLILPSRLDFYQFNITRSEASAGQIVAHLELSNWLLSFFAPSLRLVYDKKKKRLLEFRGVSNILDENGEQQEVIIRYE